MIARCFALAALTVAAGLHFNSAALLVLGCWVFLIGAVGMFWRDTRRNHNASAVLHAREQRDAEWKRHRAI